MAQIKRTLSIAATILLVIVWLAVTGLNLFCAISLQCNSDASGWWSLFLTTIAIPVLVVQLYFLRRTVRESVWEPVLDIGIMTVPTDYQIVFSDESLPTKQILDPIVWSTLKDFSSGYEALAMVCPLQIVVRNTGKRAGKHLKIHIHCNTFPGKVAPTFFIRDKEFITREGITGYVFQGGESRIVHSKDFEVFPIMLMRDLEEFENAKQKFLDSPEGIVISDIIQPGSYRFHCTTWVDGMDQPLEKDLEVEVLHRDVKLVNPYFESDVYAVISYHKQQQVGEMD